MRSRAFVLAFALLATACGRTPPEASADGALRAWLERMEGAAQSPRRAQEAFALLGPEAQANLEERARRTSLLTGRRVEPHEMLAAGRFGLRFRPKHMKARLEGGTCTIDVVGDDPQNERASVRCVTETTAAGVRYRIEPELPELRTLPRRASD